MMNESEVAAEKAGAEYQLAQAQQDMELAHERWLAARKRLFDAIYACQEAKHQQWQ